MKSRKEQLALAWITKARGDLENARLLIEQEKRLLDIAVFHCQQAAEKALKAWLTLREIIFPRTHSVIALLALCISSEPAFHVLQTHAEVLTPLGTAFRYPAEEFEPDLAVASRALAFAEEVYRFCETQIGAQQR